MDKKAARPGISATIDSVKVNQIVRCIESSYTDADFAMIKELLGVEELTLKLSNSGYNKTGWFGRVPCTEDQYKHRGVSLNDVYKKLAPTRPRTEEEFFRIFLTMLFVQVSLINISYCWKFCMFSAYDVESWQKGIAEHRKHLSNFFTDFVELTLRDNNLVIPEDFREKKTQEVKTFISEFQRIAEDEARRKVKQEEVKLVEKVNPTCYD
ncbi:unnamed protein product [Cylicostephanus goldi]|uniref:Uncharacterized protein n=1 Tax=Cylicostephanus goldi TaxID=71465 RepID=A0A3P7Q9E8_CYLGO|nr:unnamed protein product [Cylicostephanus goldi]